MAEEHRWSIGKQLQRWRKAAGLRAIDVAERLGVTQQTVSNWEVDASRPHISRAHSLEELYGLQSGLVTAILSGASPPPDAPDPELMGIRDGVLLWSGRSLWGVYDLDDAYADLDYDSDVEAAIARDADLADGDKEALASTYRALKAARSARRPTGVAPEPETP